jgi:hypothetical protein
MDDIDDLFEELNSLRKKQKQIMTQSVKKVVDYVASMDFASLYPSTMTMHFPNKKISKIEKINKILENVRKREADSN